MIWHDNMLCYGTSQGTIFLGDDLLCEACEHGHLETARVLLRCGAEINKKGTFGGAPMQLAAEKGHLELILGLSVSDTFSQRCPEDDRMAVVTDRFWIQCGWTICWWCFVGVVPVRMRCLAQARNADVNITSRFGRSPLQLASEQGHLDLVNFLIDSGAAINTKHYGRTSLQLASEQGHAEVVERLLQAGAKFRGHLSNLVHNFNENGQS